MGAGFKSIYGVRKRGPWGGLRDDNIVRITLTNEPSNFSFEPIRIDSLPPGHVVSAGRFSLVPSVGYVGSLETYDRAEFTARKSWFIRSEQGLCWNVVHAIS